MNNDIVPELLDEIQRDFNKSFNSSKKIVKIQTKISKGTATYLDANEYAVEVGEILAKSLQKFISVDVLPDGKMYFNIAERILSSTLGNNHDLISSTTLMIQELLNRNAGIGLKGVESLLNNDKVFGLINRISSEESFDNISWILDEPIVNFSQSVVDDVMRANIDFQAKSGMRPTIKRTVTGNACDWCRSLAGTYEYPNVPENIYQRHERCRCTVEYNPSENKRQNVWSKQWVDPGEKEKIEFRKSYGL